MLYCYLSYGELRELAVCGEFCVLIGYLSGSGILTISCITSYVV